MSSMVSIILVFMLTIGGSPVVPGNSADSFNISEKPLLGAKKIFPGISIKKITENQHPIKEKQILNLKLHWNLYYGYNKVHMKNYEQRMHENGIGDVFGYDAVYRLTNAKFNVPDPTVETPTDFERERNIFLDHVDNITRIDETKNGETSQITTEILPDTNDFKLNRYSRFDQWGLTYDKNGNLTQKGTQKMYFDFRDQMVRVTDGSSTTENKYDALGRRLQKIVTTGSQSKTENYYYSGHQVVEVRDGNDQVKRQFIYGNGIDEVIRMDAYSGSAITPYYFHTNAIGSTTAVTDANGQVVERYKYGLYGMPTFMDAAGNVIPNSSIGNNILFQGREYEPETNFYYFRARHLDPIMGRFLQTDPMGYEDSLNLYQAFNMNPVNFVDPFGEESYLDFLDQKIADMRSRGYSESFINQMISRGTFKRGYLAQVDYRNAYVDEMPGFAVSFVEGMFSTGFAIGDKMDEKANYILNPKNWGEITESSVFYGSRVGQNVQDEIDKGSSYMGAVCKALWSEVYNLTPIEEATIFLDPNIPEDIRADATVNFEMKMGSYILLANEIRVNQVKKAKKGLFTNSNTTIEKAVVIGEGMEDIIATARELRKFDINAKWYQAWSKYFERRNFNLAESKRRNLRWIKTKTKLGYKIYDIGIDPNRVRRSPFYPVEKNYLEDIKYPTIKIPRKK